MARRCPDWVAREDLVSAGMVGLIEAADRYDGNREEPFISFAEHRIRGAILDELRRGDIMPRRVRQLARKISAAIKELENVGVTVGTLYDDVWHDGTYITAAKLVAIGTVLGEPVLTFNVEGTGTYYLIRWAAIGRLKKAVKK